MNALTEVQLVITGTASSYPSGVVSDLPEYSDYLFGRLPLVVEQCCSLGCNCWLEFDSSSYELVLIIPLSLAEGVHGKVVDGVTDVFPFLFSTACGVVSESLLYEVGEALTQIWD